MRTGRLSVHPKMRRRRRQERIRKEALNSREFHEVIVPGARNEDVSAAVAAKRLDDMRAKEAGTPGDEDALVRKRDHVETSR